jgi:hypothetical protein
MINVRFILEAVWWLYHYFLLMRAVKFTAAVKITVVKITAVKITAKAKAKAML